MDCRINRPLHMRLVKDQPNITYAVKVSFAKPINMSHVYNKKMIYHVDSDTFESFLKFSMDCLKREERKRGLLTREYKTLNYNFYC